MPPFSGAVLISHATVAEDWAAPTKPELARASEPWQQVRIHPWRPWSAPSFPRDAEQYLARAIDSALVQTYVPLEAIVIDHGSDDATYEVATRYGTRVRVIRLPQPLGPGGARNAGIKAARGAYVAFLDADDEWLPEKTAQQVATIESAPEACSQEARDRKCLDQLTASPMLSKRLSADAMNRGSADKSAWWSSVLGERS